MHIYNKSGGYSCSKCHWDLRRHISMDGYLRRHYGYSYVMGTPPHHWLLSTWVSLVNKTYPMWPQSPGSAGDPHFHYCFSIQYNRPLTATYVSISRYPYCTVKCFYFYLANCRSYHSHPPLDATPPRLCSFSSKMGLSSAARVGSCGPLR